MKIDNLEDVIQHLKTKLPRYLEKHNIDISKRFRCINPSHDENTPSAMLNPKTGYTTGHCFGCNSTFDIFNAAHWLEGLPAEGTGWVNETIPALAEQLRVQIQYVEPSEDEKARLGVYRAYAETATYIASEDTGEWSTETEEYISKNKWDKKFLSMMGVGVCDEDEYIHHMRAKGYSIDYLVSVNLLPPRGQSSHHTPQLISADQLVFTINDEMGRPCAFAARRFSGERKFVNTGTTGEYDIYQKGQRLYGLDIAKRAARTGKPLWVVEGYGDVLGARTRSIENISATCGTALTIEQLMLLAKLGIRDIILCYDFDEAGLKSILRIIENVLPQIGDMRCRVAIPGDGDDGKDPGQLLLEKGAEGLLSLTTVPAFTWALQHYLDQGNDPTDVATRLVPVIASEPNAIIRDSQIDVLVEATHIRRYAIELEVRKNTEEAVAEQERKRQYLVKQLHTELEKDPASAVQLCEDFTHKFEDLEAEHEADRYSATSCIHMAERQMSIEDAKKPSDVPGFRLPFMPIHQECLGGGRDWSHQCLMILAGEENVGKTTLLRWWLYNIAAVEQNDAICIYWSIDDSEEEILPGLVTIANVELQGYIPYEEDHPRLTINNVVNPESSTLGLPHGEKDAILRRKSLAYDRVLELMRNERLILKDSKSGSTLSYAKSLVRYYRRKHPSKKIVLIIDNTGNLADYGGLEIRDRYTRYANTMKNGIANKYDATVIASVEYRKKGTSVESTTIQLPNNDRIAEARAMKYRANWIGHIYSDMTERPTQYNVFYTDPITGEHRPRIILYHSKTKINRYRGLQYMDLHSDCSALSEVGTEKASLEGELYFNSKKEGRDEN